MNALPITKPSGFSLIELMIGITILAILLGLALPSFQTWLKNTQIRNAAESITNGLQRARAEAVALNTNVAFVLGADSSWTVDYVVSPPAPPPPAPPPARPIDSRSATEGSKNVTLTALAADLATPATTITYNNLGQVVVNAASLTRVNLGIDSNHDGVFDTGYQNLRVEINAGGGARTCDPSLAVGSSSRACLSV